MTRKPESRLQLRIQKALRDKFPDIYIRKIHVSEFSQAGMPDLICCYRGRFVAMEVKMAGEKLSALQNIEGVAVVNAGGHWFIVTSVEEAISVMREVSSDVDREAIR